MAIITQQLFILLLKDPAESCWQISGQTIQEWGRPVWQHTSWQFLWITVKRNNMFHDVLCIYIYTDIYIYTYYTYIQIYSVVCHNLPLMKPLKDLPTAMFFPTPADPWSPRGAPGNGAGQGQAVWPWRGHGFFRWDDGVTTGPEDWKNRHHGHSECGLLWTKFQKKMEWKWEIMGIESSSTLRIYSEYQLSNESVF